MFKQINFAIILFAMLVASVTFAQNRQGMSISAQEQFQKNQQASRGFFETHPQSGDGNFVGVIVNWEKVPTNRQRASNSQFRQAQAVRQIGNLNSWRVRDAGYQTGRAAVNGINRIIYNKNPAIVMLGQIGGSILYGEIVRRAEERSINIRLNSEDMADVIIDQNWEYFDFKSKYHFQFQNGYYDLFLTYNVRIKRSTLNGMEVREYWGTILDPDTKQPVSTWLPLGSVSKNWQETLADFGMGAALETFKPRCSDRDMTIEEAKKLGYVIKGAACIQP